MELKNVVSSLDSLKTEHKLIMAGGILLFAGLLSKLILIIGVLLIITGGFFYYKNYKKQVGEHPEKEGIGKEDTPKDNSKLKDYLKVIN